MAARQGSEAVRAAKWRRFKEQDDQAARGWLIESYRYIAIAEAKKLRDHGRLPPDCEYEDVLQVGLLALAGRVDAYDHRSVVEFSTYAKHRITWAMRDYLNRRGWEPRAVQEAQRKLQRGRDAALRKQAETGQSEAVSEEAVMTALGLDPVAYGRLRDEARIQQVVALDPAQHSRLQATVGDPLRAVLANADRDLLSAFLSLLPPELKEALTVRFYEERTDADAAALLGITVAELERRCNEALGRASEWFAGQDAPTVEPVTVRANSRARQRRNRPRLYPARIQAQVDLDTANMLATLAENEGVSEAEVVRRLIREKVEREGLKVFLVTRRSMRNYEGKR